MDTVFLPIVPLQTGPAAALQIMKAHRRSGIVAQGRTGYFVVKASALIGARDRGQKSLARVSRELVVRTLEPRDLSRSGLKLRLPQGALPSEAKVFGRGRRDDFVMLAAAHDAGTRQVVGLLITRSELFAEEVSTPADYYCAGPRQHSLPPPPKLRDKTGGCGLCAAPVLKI